MNLILLSLCMIDSSAAPDGVLTSVTGGRDEIDARRLETTHSRRAAAHVRPVVRPILTTRKQAHPAPKPRGSRTWSDERGPMSNRTAAVGADDTALEFLGLDDGTAIDFSPTAAVARAINVSDSSGEAALRRWWADGRHFSTTDAFEHDTIADAGAKYAAILFGMVRTWSISRKMFQRTFLGSNSPMDLFFEVYAQDETEVDLIASMILRLPRRSGHVERWGAPIMDRLRTDHRVTVCADTPRAHAVCVEADARKVEIPARMISKARKVELGWRMMQAHVAAHRGGQDYDAVLLARTDLSYPPQPFDMAKAAAVDALLIPAGADMPLNDQLAVGRSRWLEAYATAYSHCAASSAARALYGKAIPIVNHPCGKLERSLVPAIRSRVPDEHFRRFWFQYWIVRSNQIDYFEEHNAFVYRTWASPCCWQRLNWAQPSMSLEVLVDLNTTCLVHPRNIFKHDKNSVRWPKGGSVDLLKCRYAGGYCNVKKYPSTCKDAKGPPPGPNHYLPEELPVGVYEIPAEASYGTAVEHGPARRQELVRASEAKVDAHFTRAKRLRRQNRKRAPTWKTLPSEAMEEDDTVTTAPLPAESAPAESPPVARSPVARPHAEFPPAASPRVAPASCASPLEGGNATVVRFGAVDERGLRVAGRGWGRVLARWRGRKQMKIAVLGGSMTCGGNLAKLHTGPKTNDSTSM